MKKVAIIFSNAPYGSNLGLEGLNIVLSMTCYIENIGFFFVGDGVLQILDYQKPNHIFSKSYFPTFKMFNLYNMHNFYLCYESLLQHGLSANVFYSLNVHICNFSNIRNQICNFDVLLNF
ncbi:sulfurtransferase complex subunit TusC [Buchnera aphidicola]|uniref:Sulfurtransferase complex subunit TusC n=1 Tax=Buchnera aphidicola (Sarucallis kahawaluokalani) TaxID=1241878 RepID=A0A4D6YIE1_9GAMM|nr:sulfurtransferase complex subunit TusC [Buchnera aphidicola]QCI26141.1 sulfurtransferase complex subunit TusC [Buchnera aphidicola (Sarucallis kahawaluokalani)]